MMKEILEGRRTEMWERRQRSEGHKGGGKDREEARRKEMRGEERREGKRKVMRGEVGEDDIHYMR
jgi:hypothetical protein